MNKYRHKNIKTVSDIEQPSDSREFIGQNLLPTFNDSQILIFRTKQGILNQL